MHTNATLGAPAPTLFGFSTATVAGALVALAMCLSSLVFSEPAAADVLMMGVIVGVPILGAAAFGQIAKLQIALWLVIVGLGILTTPLSSDVTTAITHQLVTLFLAVGAFVLAGYIAADPLPRFWMIIWCYTIGVTIAAVAALVGYFDVLPGTAELFTRYGRAKGTFKDPNVFGAAIVPAMTLIAWVTIRERGWKMLAAAVVFVILSLGLLVSFSRGAWVTTALAMALLVWIALVRTRRGSDFRRVAFVSAIGVVTVIGALVMALQIPAVAKAMGERASLDQSYDQGPEGRFGGQDKAIKLILDNPLGIGTHTFREKHHHEEPHNVYFSMFLNAGWIGGLAYIIAVLSTLLVGFRGCFQMNALQGPFLIATAAFASLAFEGIIIDSDHWRHFFLMMGCIWGLSDAAVPVIDARRRRIDPQ
jgi:O-antigen ligase